MLERLRRDINEALDAEAKRIERSDATVARPVVDRRMAIMGMVADLERLGAGGDMTLTVEPEEYRALLVEHHTDKVAHQEPIGELVFVGYRIRLKVELKRKAA